MARKTEKVVNPFIKVGERQTIEELSGGRITKHGATTGYPWKGNMDTEQDPASERIDRLPFGSAPGSPETGTSRAEEGGMSEREATDRAVQIEDESFSKDIRPRERDDLYR